MDDAKKPMDELKKPMEDAKKPTSALKIESNRRNSLRSTGPRSDEGKRKVSQNAVKHGMTASWATASPEDTDAAGKLYSQLYLHYRPVGPIEEVCVAEIFKSLWRILRAKKFELTALSFQASTFFQSAELFIYEKKLKNPDVDLNTPEIMKALVECCDLNTSVPCEERLDLFLRYETHADRRFMRYLTKLEQLQNARKASL